jgi:hypothetical protein
MKDARYYIKTGSIITLFVGLLIYGIFTARHFIQGPQIEVISPATGSLIQNPLIEIKGEARNVSFISLNDRPIFIDNKGVFKEKLLVPPGYSIMKIYAKDRFGREVQKGLELVYVKDDNTGTSTETTVTNNNETHNDQKTEERS